MLNNRIQEIALTIGQYYLSKNNNDYSKTEIEILNLRIVEIKVSKDIVSGKETIVIVTSRPGLLIGPKGKNIDALCFILGDVRIQEDSDCLLDFLIPYHYNDEEGF